MKKQKHAQKNSCPILWPIRLDQFFQSLKNSFLERHEDLDRTEYTKLIICNGRIWDFSGEKLTWIWNCRYSKRIVSFKET